MLRKIFLGLFLALSISPLGWAFAADVPPESGNVPEHVVRPGETLFSIAKRYGTDVETLSHLNSIPDPRQIYAGQRLSLPLVAEDVDLRDWAYYSLKMGEDLSLVARRMNLAWETVAEVNHLLNPSDLLVGQSLLLPRLDEPRRLAVAKADDTPFALALRNGIPLWEMARLNPDPLYAGAAMLLPGEGILDFLPYPIASLELTPQPVVQGNVAVFSLATRVPATCEINYLNQTEPCYAQSETQHYAFVSLSPLLDPNIYPVTLKVTAEGSGEMAFELPLVVIAGRYGYERIDAPAGREELSDPVLLQAERDKLDAIAVNYRSPDRYWQLPFQYPVSAAISSYFGSRRSYGGSYNSYHAGVDFRASTGVPVHPAQPGRVILAEQLPVRGNAIMVDHGWGVLTGYWHLSRIDVEVGQYVDCEDVIGLVGNTGLSTGSHLHWEMWADGKPVDALQWVEPFYDFPEPLSPPPPTYE